MRTAAWLAVSRRIRATFPLTHLLNLLLRLLKVKPSPLQLASTVAPLLALHLQTIHHRSSVPIRLSPHFPTLLPVTSVLTRLQVPPLVLSPVRPPEECLLVSRMLPELWVALFLLCLEVGRQKKHPSPGFVPANLFPYKPFPQQLREFRVYLYSSKDGPRNKPYLPKSN